MKFLKQDQKWMQLALNLAEKGRLTTSPNPMVGACVVRRDKLVGKGYHQVYGGDHAEVQALKEAGSRAKGATLYVTLEPCSSWGKTPPCAGAIIQAGIKEVVISLLDPNPRNYRKGVQALRREGVKVRTGVLSDAVRLQNEFFFKYINERMPFVTLKMAQSIDGKIATACGQSRWITSASSRRFVHELREQQDAILVGKNTLLMDNPLLSPRTKRKRVFQKPWRIVIDPRFEIPSNARVFRGEQITMVVVSERHVHKIKRSRYRKGCNFILVPEARGKIDLKKLLKKLAGLGVAKLLVEGGGEISWSFLESGLVDKVFWIMAPKIIGGRDAKTSVEGVGIQKLSKAIKIHETKIAQRGDDWIIEGAL